MNNIVVIKWLVFDLLRWLNASDAVKDPYQFVLTKSTNPNQNLSLRCEQLGRFSTPKEKPTLFHVFDEI